MIALQADTQIEWAINPNQNPSVAGNWINCGSYSASVVSVNGATGAVTIDCANLGAVPTNTTVNGKVLSGNITLTLNDVITLTNTGTKFLRDDGTWQTISLTQTNQINSFVRGTRTTSQGSVVAGSTVVFTKTDVTLGSNISLNTSTGIFTVKSGSTVRFSGCVGSCDDTGTNGWIGYIWKYSTDGSTWNNVGTSGMIIATSNVYSALATSPIASGSFTATQDTQLKLVVTNINTVTTISLSNLGALLNEMAWCEVEEISRQATVTNTVDYINVKKSTSTTAGAGVDIIFDTIISGNISYNTSTGYFSLTAGKTYELTAMLRQTSSNVAADYAWVDNTNTQLLNCPNGSSNSINSQGDVGISFIYTPSANIQVKLRNYAGSGSFGANQQWATIKQIGSTAQTLNSGTQAQRLAISATEGYEFYQTDEGKGKYVYNGTRWDKISNLAYLKANNTVSVNPAANTLLNFSGGVVSNCIKTNHGNGQYTLYPGVYELMGIQLLNENDAGISNQFYNYTTASYIGEKGNSADVSGSAGTGSPAFAILECTVDTQIGLRCSNDSATVTATEGNWLKIRQIS